MNYDICQNMISEKNRACNTQSLEVIKDFQNMADFGLKVDCSFIDFSKAFDKVSVSLLLEKWKKYELGSRALAWITDYLIGRPQHVIVCSALSSDSPILSGVPQDSCLGPVLFCLFVNDLLEVICHSFVKIFCERCKSG